MSYNKPSTLVYQELLNAGGSANISPDLPACIVGPANNVVTIDLNDELAKARSFAKTITTIQNGGDNWIVPVNAETQYPGQNIDTASVEVSVTDALVLTYSASCAVTGSVITAVANTIGSNSNAFDDALPWTSAKNHINVGDLVVASNGIISTVLSVDSGGSTFTVGHTFTDGTFTFQVYTKEDTSVSTVDWDAGSVDGIQIGTAGALTYPGGFTPSDASTNDGYVYAVEAEIKGFGKGLSIYIGYKAERNDLSSQIITINDVNELNTVLGLSDPVDNPLAFGVGLALANSGGRPISAIAIDQSASTEAEAYTSALGLAEGRDLYWMVPLTTDASIQSSVVAHANEMSLPANGKWRVALVNQEIPAEYFVLGRSDGAPTEYGLINSGLEEALALDSGVSLSDTVATGVFAGDTLVVQQVISDALTEKTYTVAETSGSVITTTVPVTESSRVWVYVKRASNRETQALAIKGQSESWNSSRVLNFPGDVRVNTDIAGQVVPGYFLMAAVAGLGAGLPPQHGFTNISLAGIAGLEHSNFYFTSDQLNTIAGGGTFLYEQNSQESVPYCRHGLTTDMSILEYREILKVKNLDYLSYYYKGIVDPFIGSWNITPDTLQTIRQAVTSSSEVLLGRRLPKVGSPLLNYKINTLEQDANSKDAIRLELGVAIVDPNNYTNIYLQV